MIEPPIVSDCPVRTRSGPAAVSVPCPWSRPAPSTTSADTVRTGAPVRWIDPAVTEPEVCTERAEPFRVTRLSADVLTAGDSTGPRDVARGAGELGPCEGWAEGTGEARHAVATIASTIRTPARRIVIAQR